MQFPYELHWVHLLVTFVKLHFTQHLVFCYYFHLYYHIVLTRFSIQKLDNLILQYAPKHPQTWIKTMASVNLSDHGPSLKLDPHTPENFSQIKLFLSLVWKYTINFFVWGLKIHEF